MPTCRRVFALGALGLALLMPGLASAETEALSLAGDWGFRLDPDDLGLQEGWARQRLADTIPLPGSTDEAGYGRRAIEPELGRLTRAYRYVGPAWYQRDVAVPDAWAGKRTELSLERCHWETTLFVDGRLVGTQNSLVAPHVYNLTGLLAPGTHRLSIRVDNTAKVGIGGWGHAITDETQTNWNGIVGRIELRATDLVWVRDIATYPSAADHRVRARVQVGNATGAAVTCALDVRVDAPGSKAVRQTIDHIAVGPDGVSVETTIDLPTDAPLWDEFSPVLHEVSVKLRAEHEGRTLGSARSERFGLRDFTIEGTQFALNGRPTFLRGTLECAIFPKTGYPPTDVDAWARICRIAKDYGLNHLRFHSWCPPEAAFIAADEAGMMLQVEAPFWSPPPYNEAVQDFVRAEAMRILDAYGDHPSFCLMSMGNELLMSGGMDSAYLQALVGECRAKDSRHFYTSCTHPYDGSRADDYFVSADGPGGGLRGHGPLESERPGTMPDYAASLAGEERPIIAHELGQWYVFPNLDERSKYTGPLEARAYDLYEQTMARHGTLDRADEFLKASGKLSVLLYKEEIERCLRTPGMPGFQLLDVHDFPGQGVALVGMLDAFWDSKGLIRPEEFRAYCSPTVPLARMEKRVYTTGETLSLELEVAHYGPRDLTGAAVRWRLLDGDGRAIAQGALPTKDIPTGTLTRLGEAAVALDGVRAPAVCSLELHVGRAVNTWPVWVYPEEAEDDAEGVLVTTVWDDSARRALSRGRRVLLTPEGSRLMAALAGRFNPVFWCVRLFPAQPGTAGLLVDADHPALAAFPTENHSNWQWWDIVTRSTPVVLDQAPLDYAPLVEVIDNPDRGHKAGLIFEAQVGPGRLLVCAADLSTDLAARPAARQLRASLVRYLRSSRLAPAPELSASTLDAILQESSLYRLAGGPSDARPVLSVRAAARVGMRESPPWQKSHDNIRAQDEGFDYTVEGGSWLDETSSAWHDPDLGVTVSCPSGFAGTLYVRFSDWNGLGRTGTVSLDGRALGNLAGHSSGEWFGIPITQADSADGRVTLTARATRGPNLMIEELVVIAGE